MKDIIEKRFGKLSEELDSLEVFSRYLELISGLSSLPEERTPDFESLDRIIEIASRGLVNELGFQFALKGAVIPEWISRQLDSKAIFDYKKMGLGMINNSLRNWAELSVPDQSASKIMISVKGLATPQERADWSLDFWVFADNKLIFPVNRTKVKQTFKTNFAPIFETSWSFGKLQMSEEVFTITDEGRQLFYAKFALKTSIKKSKKVTVYIAIRPFSAKSIGRIRDLDYDPAESVFYFEQKPVLRLLRTPPAAVFVHNLEDKDLSIVLNENKMLKDLPASYNKTCLAGLCSAVVKYEVTVKEKKQESFTLVAFTKTGEEKTGVAIPDYFYARDLLYESWGKHEKKLMKLKTGNKKLDELYYATVLNVLMNYKSSSKEPFGELENSTGVIFNPNKELLISTLLNLGLIDEAKELYNELLITKPKIQKLLDKANRTDVASKIIWNIGNILQQTNDLPWLQSLEKLFEETMDWLEEKAAVIKKKNEKELLPFLPMRSDLFPFSFERKFLVDSFWMIAAFQAAGMIVEKLGDQSKADKYKVIAKEIHQSVNEFIEEYNFGQKKPILPVTTLEDINEHSITALLYGILLGIFPEDASLIENTLREFKKRHLKEDAVVSNGHYAGSLSRQTAELAHFFCRRGERNEGSKILSWLSKVANPIGFWPQVINQETMAGTIGAANDIGTAIQFVNMLRDMFILELTQIDRIVLFEGVPESWLEAGPITLECSSGKYGKIAIKANLKGKIKIELSIEKRPASIELILPKEITEIDVMGTTVELIEKNRLILEGAEEITIKPSTSSKKYGWRGSKKLE